MGGTSTVYGTMTVGPKTPGFGGASGMGNMLKRRGMGGKQNDTQSSPPHHQHRWGKKDNSLNNDTKNNNNNNNNNNNSSNSKSTTRRPWQLNLRGGYIDDHGQGNHGIDHDSCSSVAEQSDTLRDHRYQCSENPPLVHDYIDDKIEKEKEENGGRNNRIPMDVMHQPPPHQIPKKDQ